MSEDNTIWELSLKGHELFYFRQVVITANARDEQEIRDKSYILSAIDKCISAEKLLEAEDTYMQEAEDISSSARNNNSSPSKVAQRSTLKLFLASLDNFAPGGVVLRLKKRQLLYIRDSITLPTEKGGPNWNNELCNIAVQLMDAIDNSDEFVTKIDKNEDMDDPESPDDLEKIEE